MLKNQQYQSMKYTNPLQLQAGPGVLSPVSYKGLSSLFCCNYKTASVLLDCNLQKASALFHCNCKGLVYFSLVIATAQYTFLLQLQYSSILLPCNCNGPGQYTFLLQLQQGSILLPCNCNGLVYFPLVIAIAQYTFLLQLQGWASILSPCNYNRMSTTCPLPFSIYPLHIQYLSTTCLLTSH